MKRVKDRAMRTARQVSSLASKARPPRFFPPRPVRIFGVGFWPIAGRRVWLFPAVGVFGVFGHVVELDVSTFLGRR